MNLPDEKLVNLTSVQWYITISTQQNQKLQKAMVASSKIAIEELYISRVVSYFILFYEK